MCQENAAPTVPSTVRTESHSAACTDISCSQHPPGSQQCPPGLRHAELQEAFLLEGVSLQASDPWQTLGTACWLGAFL